MDVNICREKKQTNVRASSSDQTVNVTPPKLLTLEGALEFISIDECVEVTPANVRIRKVELDPTTRIRAAKKSAHAD